MSRPRWLPKNPYGGEPVPEGAWEQGARSMAKALIAKIESHRWHGPDEFFLIQREVWERIKAEVEQS